MASSTFSDLPAPLGAHGPLNNTLIIIVNNDGTLSVDQETLTKLLAEQENTSTNAVRLIRLGVAPTDCRSPVSSDGEDAAGPGHVNITVEGYYPPGHGYPIAADEPLEPVIADEMNRLGQVNAMLDILSDEAFSIHDSIKMDHCYTNRLPCSDPNYTPPRAKLQVPEGRSFFTPLKKPVVPRSPVPSPGKVMLVHPVKRTLPRPNIKPLAPGSLLKPVEHPAAPPPVGITEEMLNEKMMQFQRGEDDYNDLSGDDNEDKSNSSAEQSVDVEDLAPPTSGGKTAPRPQKAIMYKGPNQRGGKRAEFDESTDVEANRTPKMHAHKYGKAGLKVYGKAKPADVRKEAVPIDDSKKNYPRRENRKPPAHLLESFAGPALFSVPDVPRRVSLDAKGAKAFEAADFDFSGLNPAENPDTPETPDVSDDGQSRLTATLLNQLDTSSRRNTGSSAQRQSVDTVSSDSLGEMEMVTEDDPNKLWCICQRPHNNRFMICCDVCGEWFHGKCVGITKAIGQTMEEHGNEWTCPNCKKMGDTPGTGRRQSKITTFMRKPKPSEAVSLPQEPPKVDATSCVVCKKTAREGTVYCSDDCLQKHAHETAMLEVQLEQPVAPRSEPPLPVLVAAPAVTNASPPAALDKSQGKKASPVTCGVKTSRPGSLKTWLKPNPALVKIMPPATATSSPIKPKQVVLIDAKPMPPTLPLLKVSKPAPAEEHKEAAVERIPVLIIPRLLLSPVKDKPTVKHEGKRISRLEAKTPEAVKKEETDPIRINVRKTLHEQLLARTIECEDLKNIADEKVKRIAVHIEDELFIYFNRDAGSKYKSKYRSLIFNIKDPKNLTLFRKIVDKSISAHQLVRLSAEEFASQELTQWREQETKHQLEMIKKNEMDLLALSKTYVMKTHKGEQVIESEDGVKEDVTKIVDMDIDSVTSGDSKVRSKNKKAKVKSKSKKSKSHKSSREHKKHHSKSSKHHKNSHDSSSSSSQKRLDDYVHLVDRREDLNTSKDSDFDNGYTGKDQDDSKPSLVMDASSVQEIIFGKASEDQEMEENKSDSPDESIATPENPYVTNKETAATVWRGVAEMPDVAKFQTTIQAVSGDSEKHCQTLPDHINIVGRISHNTVWDHVSKMKKTDTHEILVVRLTAKNESEKIAYVTLYSYLNTRNRLGVVGRKGVIAPVSQTIKDFYILPLSNHSPVPQALLPLHGPGLEDNRPHLLLGILVARSGRKRPAPVISYATKAPRLSDATDVVARVFTPPLPDEANVLSPPKPPSPSHDSRPSTPETRSTPEENSETEAETIRSKVTSLLDDDAPYSPKDEDEDMPETKLTEAEESSLALQRKMDELNRKIAEQKLEIENMSSGLVSESLIPGLGSISSFMGGEFPGSKDAEEAYSPSESITPPLKEAIPFISAPSDVIAPDISLPSNLHEILANIKKNASVEPKMDLKRDPIVQNYSARMGEEKEKIAAKKEHLNVGGAVYIPSSIKKSGETSTAKVDDLQETLTKESPAGGKTISAFPKPPGTPQMQAASGDPRKRPADSVKPCAELTKPKSTLSKLTDAELIEKAAAMELEMAASPSLVPTVTKKSPIKFSIPMRFGMAQGVGCLPDVPPPLPPPPPPPPPEASAVQPARRAGLNCQGNMPCNPPPPPNVDYHIPFTNPPPPPPVSGKNPHSSFPSRPQIPGRIPLPSQTGMPPHPPSASMSPLPPVPGMNPLPPLPGINSLPPLPGMNPLPPLPGMNPPAPGNHSLYPHHPPPYRRGTYDRNH